MLIFALYSRLSGIGPKRLCLLALLILSMPLLTGCGSQPPVVLTKVEIIREAPPPVWLVDCTDYLPNLPIVKDNGDMALIVGPLVQAIEQCTADKRALREWAKESTTPSPD